MSGSRQTQSDAETTPAQPGAGTESKRPLYLQVAGTLREEIVSGVYPVGSKLPTEDGLCERFSVSRYTVREALRLLREDGLVASRKRAGTVVIPPRVSGSDIQQVMSINDLLALGTDTRFRIDAIHTVTIDTELAAHTGLEPGEQWLRVEGFRFNEGENAPASRTEHFINRKYAAVGRLLQRHEGPIFPLIEDLFGINIVRVEQQISAAILPPPLAAVLEVEEGSAALEIRRTYTTADASVAQITINIHPGTRFQHSMSMRRVRN
ncbi:GntR family transcriptional regulator [Mangrovimicrobium sediminis]|uniref:GntR family transcriptional regulator n=1 Tax=Mangrovimicrobium sediminis TaxID=2562682 RepID=A0A4Z0LUS9_9GAMM|nr:GntR family transcriptional regulator [Haliea sp. SAOS-164]TGD71072.1 GntR family transcriptional regulator [Haliea sp. SAOS-164]